MCVSVPQVDTAGDGCLVCRIAGSLNLGIGKVIKYIFRYR